MMARRKHADTVKTPSEMTEEALMQEPVREKALTLRGTTRQALDNYFRDVVKQQQSDAIIGVTREPWYNRRSKQAEKWEMEFLVTHKSETAQEQEVLSQEAYDVFVEPESQVEPEAEELHEVSSDEDAPAQEEGEEVTAQQAYAPQGATSEEVRTSHVTPEEQAEELPGEESTGATKKVMRRQQARSELVQSRTGRSATEWKQLERAIQLKIIADRAEGMSYAKIDTKYGLGGMAKTLGHIAWSVCKAARTTQEGD